MALKSSILTQPRLAVTRRSVIATVAGLALSASRSNSAQAQISTEDLPDASSAISQIMPMAAPNLKFSDATGKILGLGDYRGSGLIVNIWATWCGPCIAELPTFAAISPVLAKNKILVLPISVDMEGAQAVAPYFASHNIKDLPVLLDPTGASVRILNAQGIPVTIIINPQGQLVARLDGSANWNSPATLALMRQLAGPQTDGNDVQPA